MVRLAGLRIPAEKKPLANQSKLHLRLVDTIKVSVITVGILQELFKGTDLVLIKQCKTHFNSGSQLPFHAWFTSY